MNRKERTDLKTLNNLIEVKTKELNISKEKEK